MKNKKFIILLIVIAILTLTLVSSFSSLVAAVSSRPGNMTTVAVKDVSQQIEASGSVHSQQEAVLHFQTGGKLVYLPFRQGDVVEQGQTIAQLDSYALQKELAAALNTYRSTRDTYDQTQANSQNGVLFGQQRYNIEVFNKSGITTGDAENNIINSMIQRIIDQNQANLDNAVINVELANDALQLATLTAPFSGVITHEDVTTPNVNVTPVTSFSIADPTEKVFRADVAASDIDFVSIGATATVKLDGQNKVFTGHVIAIYPQKQTLPTGEQVYETDIQVDGLNNFAFGQNGSALITSNATTKAYMVPTWTIVGHTKIWVWDGKQMVLRSVQMGATHGDMTEITKGLLPTDRIVTTPKSIAKEKYQLL